MTRGSSANLWVIVRKWCEIKEESVITWKEKDFWFYREKKKPYSLSQSFLGTEGLQVERFP